MVLIIAGFVLALCGYWFIYHNTSTCGSDAVNVLGSLGLAFMGAFFLFVSLKLGGISLPYLIWSLLLIATPGVYRLGVWRHNVKHKKADQIAPVNPDTSTDK